MPAIKDHETRVAKVEARQKEQNTKLDKLTKTLAFNIRTPDMFPTTYSISIHAGKVSEHLKKIYIGLRDGLMLSFHILPNLVNPLFISNVIN